MEIKTWNLNNASRAISSADNHSSSDEFDSDAEEVPETHIFESQKEKLLGAGFKDHVKYINQVLQNVSSIDFGTYEDWQKSWNKAKNEKSNRRSIQNKRK